MPDAEETRLRGSLAVCRRLSLDASDALMHAHQSVANDNDAFLKLLEADATAREQYAAARAALRAYRTRSRLN